MPDSEKIGTVLAGIPDSTPEEIKAFDDNKPPKKTLADLGNGPNEVQAFLDSLVKANKIRQSIADAVMTAWKAEQSAGVQPGTPPGGPQPGTPPVSSVPQGHVDITNPQPTGKDLITLKCENTDFTIPSQFAPAPVATPPHLPVVDPISVEPWQWLHIAMKNNLTRALHLGHLYKGKDPPFAQDAAFLWKTPLPNFLDNMQGDTEVEQSISVEEKMVKRNSILDGSLSGGYLTSTLSVKASSKASAAQQQLQKTVYMSARIWQSKCTLNLIVFDEKEGRIRTDDGCLVPSPEFLAEIQRAVSPTSVTGDRFTALHSIFERYGHVIPTSVTLGGVLRFEREIAWNAMGGADSVVSSFQVALNIAKAKSQLSPKAKTDWVSEVSNQMTSQEALDEMSFDAVGGDTAFNAAPTSWIETTKDPALWQTMKMDGIRPITDWLDTNVQDMIETIFETARSTRWCSDELKALLDSTDPTTRDGLFLPGDEPEKPASPTAPTSGAGGSPTAPAGGSRRLLGVFRYALPYFPKDHFITLSNIQDPSTESYLVAENRVQDVTPPAYGNETGFGGGRWQIKKRLDAKTWVDPNSDGTDGFFDLPELDTREEGVFWNHCQPAPLRAGPTDMRSCRWRLEYVGKTSDSDHAPLYWIVSEDGQWVLSAFHQPGYKDDRGYDINLATLYPYEKEKARRKDATYAQWNLYFADPTGRLDLDNQGEQKVVVMPEGYDYFLLWNPGIGGFLCDYATFRSHIAYIQQYPDPWTGEWGETTYVTDHWDLGSGDAPMFQRTAVRGWNGPSDPAFFRDQGDYHFRLYIWKITDQNVPVTAV